MMRAAIALFCLALAACAEKDKSTLGDPTSFQAAGEGPALLANLRSLAVSSSAILATFPLQDAHTARFPPITALLDAAGAGGAEGSAGEAGAWRWLRAHRGPARLRIATDGAATTLEYLREAPFLYLRQLREGDRARALLAYETPNQGRRVALYEFSTSCRESVWRSELDASRRDELFRTGPGALCPGLEPYRPGEIPAAAGSLLSGVMPELDTLPPPGRSWEFYERL